MKPDLTEARRLLDAGMHLVQLKHNSKAPAFENWNSPQSKATVIDPKATGYGLPLELNKMVSIDPDNVELARIGMRGIGHDLEALMAAGVRTISTRPGSGGRSAFAEEPGLSRIVFSTVEHKVILELRAGGFQDVVPGLVYATKDGEICTQQYANERRYDDLPGLPDNLLMTWQRLSSDIIFLRETQAKFAEAVGSNPQLAISTGKSGEKLAFAAPGHRGRFNSANRIEDILKRHGYWYDEKSRNWSHPGATGEPGIHPIPGRDGLWRSHHAGDPLSGTFDAWIAFVVLDHQGDMQAAINEMDRISVASDWTQTVPDELPPSMGITQNAVKHIPNVVSAQNFISELVAPEYVWRQILRKGWLYALTANPGAGKTSIALLMSLKFAQGKPLHGNLTMKSRVLYLCGENPDDVRLRFERMLQEEQISPADIGDSICFTRRPFAIDSATQRQSFIDDVSAFGRFDVCVIDTGHAHSDAEEENDNRAAHDLGQCMRDLGSAIGNPCILALMHPVKNASRDNLLPRGGSAFGGTIDGVLCVWHEDGVSELFAHSSKFRGRQFDPLRFTLKNVDHPTLKDNFGFPANTVIASPEMAQSIVEQRMTEAAEMFTINQEVLEFVRRVIDEGSFVVKEQSPAARHIFSKTHREHTHYPKSLQGEQGKDRKRKLAFSAIEALESDGLLVHEVRWIKGRPANRERDNGKLAYWIPNRRESNESDCPF
jgi:hypothetical protein